MKGIRSLCTNNSRYLKTNNMQSESFQIKGGLRQVGVLCSLLFTVFLHDIIKDIDKHRHTVYICYYKLGVVGLTECVFVDDLIVRLQGSMNFNKI